MDGEGPARSVPGNRHRAPSGAGSSSSRLDRLADFVHRQRWLLATVPFLFLFQFPLGALFAEPGNTMEEGTLLIGGELVLRGWTPHGDFEHLYGPADLWTLAAAFSIFGVSITVERVVGLLYRVVLLWAIYRIAGRWGTGVATATAGLAWLLIAPFGLIAYSWIAALAFGVAALAVALDADESSHRWLAAGALAGVALLFRADLILALALGLGPLVRAAGREHQKRFVAGLGGGAVGYVVHLATAGPAAVVEGMLIDPVVRLRAGRRLPVPPNSDTADEFFARLDDFIRGPDNLPGLGRPAQITALFWVTLLAAVLTIWLVRRDRRLRAFSLLAVGAIPQLLQRPTPNHIKFVGVLIFPALAIALARHLRWRALSGLAAVWVFACLAAIAPHYVGRAAFDTYFETDLGAELAFNSRAIAVDSDDVVDLFSILRTLDSLAEPGDSVFVGPERLARTNYSETFLYHLLPDYEPASYHIQMNPGLANREGGRLAADIEQADWLILTNLFNGWSEPNDSTADGDLRADAVVESSFCPVSSFGPRTLYGNC
ncbi:MAG: glycosyltransferase family 39 protein [Acidimicrobiaceae bacterium]|nr:glycosyltransferase family 39 protein [Acidimicrobiaceae bacterium]